MAQLLALKFVFDSSPFIEMVVMLYVKWVTLQKHQGIFFGGEGALTFPSQMGRDPEIVQNLLLGGTKKKKKKRTVQVEEQVKSKTEQKDCSGLGSKQWESSMCWFCQ